MRKIFSLVILSILFIQLASFAFAQGIPSQPKERENLTLEEIQAIKERVVRNSSFIASIWSIAFISLIASFFIARHRIKRDPKVSNLIIHIIVALESIAIFIMTLVSIISLSSLNFYYPFILLFSLLSLLFSLFIIKDIAKKKDIPYRSNMSSTLMFAWIIFSLLIPLAEFTIKPIEDFPFSLIHPLLTVPIMLAAYSILAAIGYFIDRSKN